MKINMGEKIRQLRHQNNRTQEDLAQALGVTCQAISRWEAGGGCPDVELIPSIANYFGVSIDVLFGFHSSRDRRVGEILARVDSYGIKARSDGPWMEECINLLREGLAEFPMEERLRIKLADVLCDAGWRRHQEWTYYDEEGYIRHDYDRQRKNVYWAEAVKICENLADTAEDYQIVTEAISILVMLYRNFGESDKAIAYANRMPDLSHSRELLLAAAADRKEEAYYIGDALLKMAERFAEQIVYGLVNNLHHYESDMPIEKIKGAISLFHLLCDDGNFGEYHGNLMYLYLYLSRIQWERGYHDDAFESLYKSLEHARALEALLADGERTFTAPLVSFVKCRPASLWTPHPSHKIAEKLPDVWPMWTNPDYSRVEKEIKADPRWAEWVAHTRAL